MEVGTRSTTTTRRQEVESAAWDAHQEQAELVVQRPQCTAEAHHAVKLTFLRRRSMTACGEDTEKRRRRSAASTTSNSAHERNIRPKKEAGQQKSAS